MLTFQQYGLKEALNMSKNNSQRKSGKDVINAFLVVLADYCGIFNFHASIFSYLL